MDKWYNLEYEEVIEKLNSNIDGISEEEAKNRLIKYGYNKLKEVKKKNILSMFLEQFKSVMIIVLLIAAMLSFLVSIIDNHSFVDTIIILVVVGINAILGVIQEVKAEKAIEALKKMSMPYIKVKRNNKVLSVKVEELVVGDIVIIEAGDYIPADMRIIESHSLRIEEAALTGESVPVEKSINKINDTSSIGDRFNMLHTGSSVAYGRGLGVVTETGMDTELGKIAETISNVNDTLTPLQKKMKELSKAISIIIVIIAIIMIIIGMIEGRPILDVFMLSIALAVAAIPEGLATVITITLAIGVQKMAKEKSIVRKLSAVEALGSTQVICSDKTGTLTQNKMTVKKIYINNKIYDETDDLDIDILSKIFTLCNDTTFGEDKGYKVMLGDPTETALIKYGEKSNINKEEYEKLYKRIEEIPFDSTRKMMTTINKIDNKYMVNTKGAVESVIKQCKYINIDNELIELTDEIKNKILSDNLNLAKSALRVLAFAYKYEEDKFNFSNEEDLKNIETNLIFAGMVGMIDPPRDEAKESVKQCFEAGMLPIMITGDNIDTAVAIAKEIGIIKEDNIAITGIELDKMNDEELEKIIKNITVYARVSPENKIRIVRAWKKLGKVVAMTGDGVNDAPALKAADIGIGMGITGTEVSKSVSSMVLSDDNFATIVVAVKEGRRIYTNIQNVIVYLLASNLAEVIIVFIATLMGRIILLPIQILWINLITDTIPAIALGFEKGHGDIMKQKPRESNEKFFTPFIKSRIIIPAIIKAILIFTIYIIVEKSYGSLVASSCVFLTLATIEMLFSFVCRSDRYSVFKIGIFSNRYLVVCVTATLIIQYIMLNTPITRQWLKAEYIPTNLYIHIMILVLLTIAIFEINKIILAKIYIKK